MYKVVLYLNDKWLLLKTKQKKRIARCGKLLIMKDFLEVIIFNWYLNEYTSRLYIVTLII